MADGDRTYLSSPVYAGFGGLTSVTMGNGDVESVSYNDRLELTQLSLVKGSTLLQRYDYAYGEVNQSTGSVDTTKNTGRIARIEGFIGGTTSSPTRQWQQRFSYDSLDRLETAGEYQGDTLALTYKSKFSYDRFGNRFRKAADNTTGSTTTNWVETNQVDPATNRFVNSTTSITYDEAGNVTADPKFRGMQYRYDANGRMVGAALTGGTQASSAVYDGMGQRVATNAFGSWRYMVYDAGGRMIAEYGGADSQNSGGVRYLFTDHQGSVRAVLNENGWVAGRYDYQPFGEEVGAGTGLRTIEQGYNSTEDTRQKYGMTERDEATGLDHTDWRKYEQNAGRWTSPDPLKGHISDPQSFNRFSYTGNNPGNRVDPSGLEWVICDYDESGNPIYCGGTEGVDIWTTKSASDYVADAMFVLNSRFGGFRFGTGDAGNPPDPCGTPPAGPSGLSGVDENIKTTQDVLAHMRDEAQKNADLIRSSGDLGSRAAAASAALVPELPGGEFDQWFSSKVASGMPWDYKRFDPIGYPVGQSKFEDFGNFNYGAVGAAAGYSLSVLQHMAGYVQPHDNEGTKTNEVFARLGIGGTYPYGDQLKDAVQIDRGFNYFHCKHP